jgi:hypothetical protein
LLITTCPHQDAPARAVSAPCSRRAQSATRPPDQRANPASTQRKPCSKRCLASVPMNLPRNATAGALSAESSAMTAQIDCSSACPACAHAAPRM